MLGPGTKIMSMGEPRRNGVYVVLQEPQFRRDGHAIVRLNDWYIRLTLDQAIKALDVFNDSKSTPCWRADVPVARVAALVAAGVAGED
jgi:hypothetical protein